MAFVAPLTTRCGETVCCPSGTGFFAFAMTDLLPFPWAVDTSVCRQCLRRLPWRAGRHGGDYRSLRPRSTVSSTNRAIHGRRRRAEASQLLSHVLAAVPRPEPVAAIHEPCETT